MLIKTKNTKKTTFPIIAFTVFLVFFIFLTNSVNSYASNTYTLPVNVDDYRSNNSLFPDDFYLTVEEDIINWFSTAGAQYLALSNYDSTSNIIVPGEVGNGYCYVFVTSAGYFNDTSSVSSIYSTYLTYNFQPYTTFRLRYTIDSNNNLSFWGVSNFYSSASSISFFGPNHSIEYNNSGLTYQLLYPLFVNSDVYDVNDNLVITRNYGGLTEEEVFNAFEDGLDITSTISNGIDNSLTDLQNQKGFFDNLVSNLKNFFNSLNGWINNGFSTLMGNIKNFFGPLLRNIQNYINEFKGSFEDFKDKFNHFIEIINSIYSLGLENNEFSFAKFLSVLLVPDSNELQNSLSGSVLYTLITGVISVSTSELQYWYNIFTGTEHTYVFTLPNFTFGGKTFTGLTVNFDWYLPYKSYGDGIISAFLIIGYIQFVRLYLVNLLKGGSGISLDNKEDDSYHRTNIGF